MKTESRIETKRENFRRLAEARTTRALRHIRLLRNLANRSAYEYDSAEVEEILQALRVEIEELAASFAPRGEKRSFALATVTSNTSKRGQHVS